MKNGFYLSNLKVRVVWLHVLTALLTKCYLKREVSFLSIAKKK